MPIDLSTRDLYRANLLTVYSWDTIMQTVLCQLLLYVHYKHLKGAL